MAKQNIAFLYGRVAKPPIISKNLETEELKCVMLYIDTIRALREVGDNLQYTRHEFPLVITKEKACMDKMVNMQVNDMIFIKGVVTSKPVPKPSYCPNCKDENGNATRNVANGNIVYITPVFVDKIRSFETKDDAVEDLINNREISNQIFVCGTLLKDPKVFTTEKKLRITQYPIALNRKFFIRTDDPSVRTDYPVVKSYGEQAISDKTYLKFQSEVIIDGFLQARNVTRKTKCSCCEKIYEWKDHAMEIVPYAVEYVSGYKSNEDIEAEFHQTVDEYKKALFDSLAKDELEEEFKTDDLR